MKLKISKNQETALIVIIIIILGRISPLLGIDYFKEVNFLSYIFTSIITLSAFVLFLSKIEVKGFQFQKLRTLVLFLVFLILQLIIDKFIILGIIVNFICFTIDSTLFIYLKTKEEELKKEGNKQ